MRVLLVMVGAVVLAACANEAETAVNNLDPTALPGEGSVEDNALQAVDEGEPEESAAGPAAVIDDSMEWRFAERAGQPNLSYGEPQTDNVRLSIDCDGDMAQLHFMRPGAIVERRPDALIVESGGMEWKSEISARPSELSGMAISAPIPLSAGAMTAFRAGNPIAIRWGDETIRVPPTDQADRFFDACG